MITDIIYFQGALSSGTVGSVFGVPSEEISQIASEYAERVCMERGGNFALSTDRLFGIFQIIHFSNHIIPCKTAFVQPTCRNTMYVLKCVPHVQHDPFSSFNP